MKQEFKRVLPMLLAGACAAGLSACGGGGSSSSTQSSSAQQQYAPRQPVVGDERVYQITDTYNDGSSNTYTQKRVVTQYFSNGVFTTQAFDAGGNLVQVDSLDSTRILSVTTYSSSGARVCTDLQPRPNFASPYTVGETFSGTFSTGCLPDGLTASVQSSGQIATVEHVTAAGADHATLKEVITGTTTASYAANGSSYLYSYTDTETDWEDTAAGVVVRSELTRTYTGNAPTPGIVGRTRVLVSYVNK
jgi:hypothetical protein